MSTTEPIPLSEMARRLGWKGPRPGRRLLRELRRRERSQGVTIMTRSGPNPKSPWQVTESSVYRHCPDMRRSKADEVARDVAKFLGRIDDRIRERVAEQIEQTVEPQLEELRQVDSELANGLKGLAERLEVLAGWPSQVAHGSPR